MTAQREGYAHTGAHFGFVCDIKTKNRSFTGKSKSYILNLTNILESSKDVSVKTKFDWKFL